MKLKISRILHAGYVFEFEKIKIAFDPIFENPFSHNCYAFPSVSFDLPQIQKLKFDAVFISHFHDDHCSMESLIHLNKETPIYMYCVHEEMFDLIRRLGFTKVFPLILDCPVAVGGIEVIPRRALDADVDSLFQIKAGDVNILNVVDSWIDDETLDQLIQEKPWDMILWPFQTMREIEVIAPHQTLPEPPSLPEEWISQLQKLNPRFLIPSSCQFKQESWSWYNHALFPMTYIQFASDIKLALPQTEVIRLNPSVSLQLDRKTVEFTSPLSWVHPVGHQDVDYDFFPESKPPLTADVAKNFRALSSDETKRVLDYCRVGLLEKFRSMEPPLEEYFEKLRGWKLSIFDHLGAVTNFYYRLDGNSIERLDVEPAGITWVTEIPMAKLQAGLESGESLTSMYVRIHAEPGVDIVDDPLIRCLFNGAFASYQKAQLKRLGL